MLARQGWQVLLLERERFPRDHIGESLLPASIPVLEELGVLPAVQEAGFLRKWGATMVWGTDKTPWSWYFRETNQRYPHSYQVWRPQFDQLLLHNSRAHGVEVREGHQVVDVLFEDGRACGVRYTADGAAGVCPGPFRGRRQRPGRAPGAQARSCAAGTPSSRIWQCMAILLERSVCPRPMTRIFLSNRIRMAGSGTSPAYWLDQYGGRGGQPYWPGGHASQLARSAS